MPKPLHNTIINLLSVFVILFGISLDYCDAKNAPRIFFIFGDSLLDVGTNNYLIGSLATANNPFYGIDFPNSIATGRFSNGYNMADLIVSQLSFSKKRESPPPFLALVRDMESFKTKILSGGVNFASGGAGILNNTGRKAFGNVISWEEQIEQFETVCGNITEEIGAEKAKKLISNALYVISVGSNDLFDYNRDQNSTPPQQLIANLTQAFGIRLKALYDLGARKFAILGAQPVGSVPQTLSFNGGIANETLNNIAKDLQASMLKLVQNFSSANPGTHNSLANTYDTSKLVIDIPILAGFTESKEACCGVGPNNGRDKCKPTSNLCKNRDSYIFFDYVHPTQRANTIAIPLFVYGVPPIVTPINFLTLANIKV